MHKPEMQSEEEDRKVISRPINRHNYLRRSAQPPFSGHSSWQRRRCRLLLYQPPPCITSILIQYPTGPPYPPPYTKLYDHEPPVIGISISIRPKHRSS
ncbi:hypothetical protein LINPERHAP2_LOCUS1701 [Linum perenne]